jgi:hypothetical protein
VAFTVTARGTGGNSTGATSIAIVPGSNLAAGTVAVLCISYDNSGSSGADPYSSISDNVGNIWVPRQNSLNDPGAANAGNTGRIFDCAQNVRALTTSDTITISFGSTSVPAKAWALWEVKCSQNNCSTQYITGGQASQTSSTPSITTGSITTDDVVIGCITREQNGTRTDDADSSNGTWSTGQATGFGTTTGGAEIITQYKVVSGTATQTYNPTFGGTSADGCNLWVQYREVLGVGVEGSVGGPPAFGGLSGGSPNFPRGNRSGPDVGVFGLTVLRRRPAEQPSGEFIPAEAPSGSVTEATSATDAPTATLEAVASVSESASSGDAPSATLATSASVTESASATDASTGGALVSDSVSESATATDTPSVAFGATGSVTESATAGDAPSTILAAVASVTESGSAADAPSSTVATAATLTETGSATDAPSATQATARDVTETASAADAPSVTLSTAASVTESGSAADTPSAETAGQQSGSVTETASATDAPSATLSTSASITESGSASDAPASTRATSAAVAEPVSASDAPVGSVTYVAAVLETATPIDVGSAFAAIAVAVSESASATDTTTGTSGEQISEPCAALDAVMCTVAYLVAHVEVATATDECRWLTAAPAGFGYRRAGEPVRRPSGDPTARPDQDNTTRP